MSSNASANVPNINALVPTQTGNSGKVLETDGSTVAWVTPSGGAVTSVSGRTGAIVLATTDITGLTADLAALAPIASPSFTGTVTVDTLTGILMGSSGVCSTATPGTDFVAPATATVFTAQQNFGAQTLTYGSTVTWDLATQQTTELTLAGNASLSNPTNMVNGGTYILSVTQDGTGSRTLAYGTAYLWPGGVAPTLSTTAGAVDVLTFVSNGTVMRGAISQGYTA
jgi:hypothetical protein